MIVLSHELWRDAFGGDEAIVGKTFSLSDGSFTVIGVLERGADYPQFAQFYVPLEAIAATEQGVAGRGISRRLREPSRG